MAIQHKFRPTSHTSTRPPLRSVLQSAQSDTLLAPKLFPLYFSTLAHPPPSLLLTHGRVSSHAGNLGAPSLTALRLQPAKVDQNRAYTAIHGKRQTTATRSRASTTPHRRYCASSSSRRAPSPDERGRPCSPVVQVGGRALQESGRVSERWGGEAKQARRSPTRYRSWRWKPFRWSNACLACAKEQSVQCHGAAQRCPNRLTSITSS